MLEYYSQHPFYAFLVAILALAAFAMCVIAAKARIRHSRHTAEKIKKLKKDNELRNEFAILTPQLISNSENDRLFNGVALNLIKRVADKEDMASEFDTLTTEQKYIYCMYNLIEDSEKCMSDFFRQNTAPMTTTAGEACRVILGDEFYSLFETEYSIFDDENEEVSYDAELVAKTDEKAAPTLTDGTAELLCGKYIKSNTQAFVI